VSGAVAISSARMSTLLAMRRLCAAGAADGMIERELLQVRA
jgi:hypothetical protein